MANLDKLNKIASGKSGWLEKAKKRQENKEWLKHSQKIAVKILRTLRENKTNKKGISKQTELASAVGVSPQQINKIVKGKENLTLETISKLEKALSISLIFAQDRKQSSAKKLITETKVIQLEVYTKKETVKNSFTYSKSISQQLNYVAEEHIEYAKTN